jgi:hypothetical protein
MREIPPSETKEVLTLRLNRGEMSSKGAPPPLSGVDRSTTI